MARFKSYFKNWVLMALLAIMVPATMGCFESPLESTFTANSSDPNEPGQTDTLTDPEQPGDPSDPGEPQTVRVLERNTDAIDSNPLINLITSVVRTVSRLLGGVISVLDVSLQVPPLALDRNTSISIDIPDSTLYVYDFGPDGLQFNIPATITISYDYADLAGVDESKIRLAWWDEAAQQWVDMPCVVDQNSNTVTGPVYHFSSYGLISD